MLRMQYCFNCGKELGVYNKPYGDLDTCGDRECEKAAADAYMEREAEIRENAERDNYDRYR